MTGKLSDRPMMRAASMPHRGQITPTAVLGLLAIPSLLTRLDAASALTVRMILQTLKSRKVSRNTSIWTDRSGG
jgi:hypothetical protein